MTTSPLAEMTSVLWGSRTLPIHDAKPCSSVSGTAFTGGHWGVPHTLHRVELVRSSISQPLQPLIG